MTNRITLLFILIGLNAWTQNANEKLLFSFVTERSKTLQLTLDTVNNIMIYRFGRKAETELEIRDDLNDSIPVFTYSFYYRGGGQSNSGLDLNYITFINGGYKYVIYSEYSAEEDDTSIGIRVTDLNEGITKDISGNYTTLIGSLDSPFRWDELIPTVSLE